jgi:hypothetical protein
MADFPDLKAWIISHPERNVHAIGGRIGYDMHVSCMIEALSA